MCTLKLASTTGTVLGSVTFPDLWLSYLNVSGAVEFSTVGNLGAVFRDHGIAGPVGCAHHDTISKRSGGTASALRSSHVPAVQNQEHMSVHPITTPSVPLCTE